jgi:hypothetical protein
MSKQKKYHYIYKTTCLITGKFYVGMHSTDNLEDGYLGSGKILGYSRAKYGDENHVREILEHCDDRKSLASREKEIVNEELLKDPLNINLKYGGDGGGKFSSKEQQRNASIAGNRSPNRNHKVIIAKILATKNLRNSGNYFGGKHNNFAGRKHSNETKKRMSESAEGKHDGEKNSQFGTCWVTNNIKSLKIKKEQLDDYLQNGYSRGRAKKII